MILNKKYCKACDKKKDIDDFGKDVRALDGRYSICKKCVSDRQKYYKGKKESDRDFFNQFSPI